LKGDRQDKKKRFKPKDSWKLIAPKSGEPIIKVVNGKTYNYCKFHQQWTAHSPKDCDRNPINQKGNHPNNDKDAEKEIVIINKAYHAIIHDDDEESNNK
jgi:hypothetical protein